GRCGENLVLYRPAGLKAKRLMLLGLGEKKSFSPKALGKALADGVKKLDASGSRDAALLLPAALEDGSAVYDAARNTVLRAEEALYRFEQCKSEKNPPKRPLRRLAFLEGDRKRRRDAERGIEHGRAIAAGMSLTRDLANLPGNLCTPTYLADQAKKLGRRFDKLKVTALTEKQMERLGMGALLSVSRGSRQEARLIVMEYNGGRPGSRPVVLVGKGLTFDAGGISLKPSANMDEMKYDMCGGASVIGTLRACAELELPINLVGIVPASENLPDGDANKPGDIVTSMAGLTIEILNTDAEGRLILCDALTYADRFKPAAVIDIATLTGACIVALGHHISGLLGNDDKLVEEVLAAGESIDDRAWRLPMGEEYQKQLESPFADIANIGGKGAGTITAACFLSRFTEKYKWAHLDIAGTAWKSGGKEKGATGRPVPLLTEFLLRRCKLVP
ncbi:MAG TPA: leucyl aminopeptidase, partial [Thiolapillus brandeum]|nr:leucyl aminopeptidase [Thiolapillus brandeum]